MGTEACTSATLSPVVNIDLVKKILPLQTLLCLIFDKSCTEEKVTYIAMSMSVHTGTHRDS